MSITLLGTSFRSAFVLDHSTLKNSKFKRIQIVQYKNQVAKFKPLVPLNLSSKQALQTCELKQEQLFLSK